MLTTSSSPCAGGSHDYDGWNLTSVRHWDELAAGDWVLTVHNAGASDGHDWQRWGISVYGTGQSHGVFYAFRVRIEFMFVCNLKYTLMCK